MSSCGKFMSVRKLWLKADDPNPRYFQMRCTDDDEMQVMATEFYTKLFMSEGSEGADELLQHTLTTQSQMR